MHRKSDLVLKVLSLGIGLAVGIVLVAKVCFELSYDNFYRDADRIYLIMSGVDQQGEKHEFPQVSGAVAPGFKTDVPGVEEATRTTFYFENPNFVDEEQNVITAERFALADTCFFKVFDRPILSGNPTEILAKPLGLMVSRSFAEKIGGVEQCIGKTIFNQDQPELKMTVQGVFEDFPKNGTIDYDLIMALESCAKSSTENWVGNDRYIGFVKLQPNVDPTTLDLAIHKMQEAHQPLAELEKNGTKLWYTLTPLLGSHIQSPDVRFLVILLSIVAALLITISLLNYILIVISSMVHRAKEIGVRKCYGAGTADIYALLGREAVVHLFLSLALATVIIFASREVIQNLLGVAFRTLLIPQSLVAIGLVLILVLFVSSVVPARLYLRIPVSVAFRNYSANTRRWKIAFLGIQVLINVFIVSMVIILSLQYRKMVQADHGYDYRNVYSVALFGGGQEAQQRVLETLASFPGVTAVGAAYNPPFVPPSGDNVCLPGDDRELFNVADGYEATESFFRMLGFDFVAGRPPRDSSEVAVSASFVKRMADFADWSDGAVGKTFLITGHEEGGMQNTPYTISGVYRDIRMGIYAALQNRPSVYFYGSPLDGKSYMPYLIFKTQQEMDDSLSMRISHALAATLDGRQLPIVSWEEEIRSAYEDGRKIRNTLLVGSLFAMLIAVLGLFGFVRDESNRRSKEIAIRKISGATSSDVRRLLLRDVLKFSLLMAVAGCVASYFVASKMLEQFAEQITLTPLHFIVAAAAVLLIVCAVVLLCSHRFSKTNPSQLLRNE